MVFLEGRYGDAEKLEREARVNSTPSRSLNATYLETSDGTALAARDLS
jgi:hypothetical protein